MAGGRGTSLRRYALTRLALVLPMIFIVLTLVFLLMRVAPGDPITASLGGHVPPAVVNQIKDQLGYDKPLLVQYREYLWNIAQGDFGTTITDRRSVGDIIVENGTATLELTFYAMIVAIVVGVTFGMVAGRYRDTWIDGGSRLFGILIYATPVFFLGLMAQLFFSAALPPAVRPSACDFLIGTAQITLPVGALRRQFDRRCTIRTRSNSI